MVTEAKLRSAVTPQLERGEKLLWVGKPRALWVALQNRQALAVGIVIVGLLLGLVMAFPSTRIFSTRLTGLGFGFGWLLLFFVLLGLTYFAQPIYDYLMARRTIYAVTDRRAIIFKGTLRGRKTLSYRQISQIKRRRGLLSGKNNLIFGSERYRVRRSSGSQVRTREIGFFGIDDAREVEQIMLETLQQPAVQAAAGV